MFAQAMLSKEGCRFLFSRVYFMKISLHKNLKPLMPSRHINVTFRMGPPVLDASPMQGLLSRKPVDSCELFNYQTNCKPGTNFRVCPMVDNECLQFRDGNFR